MRPEEELSVEIGDLDGVHVYDVNILEPRQGEVLEQFAAQTTGTNHQNPSQLPNLFPQLIIYLLNKLELQKEKKKKAKSKLQFTR